MVATSAAVDTLGHAVAIVKANSICRLALNLLRDAVGSALGLGLPDAIILVGATSVAGQERSAARHIS